MMEWLKMQLELELGLRLVRQVVEVESGRGQVPRLGLEREWVRRLGE
jgi:hypothetical protein